MSERMTGINLPGEPGFADYGRKTPEEMIAAYRKYARQQLGWAQAVLAAADEDFRVETYVGSEVRRNRTVLQEGRPRA